MKVWICGAAVFISSVAFSQSKKELMTEVAKLKSEIELLKKVKEADVSTNDKKVAYGIGVLIAGNLKAQGGDSLDISLVNAGLTDEFANKPLKLTKDDASMLVQEYMQKAGEKKRAKVKNEGIAFLAGNKTKEGVITTASGLQYKVVKAGNGKTPTATDQVTINYTGTTIDGTIFDSTDKAGKPLTYPVNKFVAGWTEALQLMHEGDKWMLYIPSELGYGERGSGGAIPPNSTLIFEIELLKVN